MDGEFLKTIEALIGIVIEQGVNTKALAAQLTTILGQLDLGELMDVGVERFGAMREALTGIVGKVEFAGEPGGTNENEQLMTPNWFSEFWHKPTKNQKDVTAVILTTLVLIGILIAGKRIKAMEEKKDDL